MADPLINAVAFNGTVIMAWEGKLGELWVSANRGISGFVGVQGGWDAPTALIAAGAHTYSDINMCFSHMGFCWIESGGGAGATGKWVSKDFGKTWTAVAANSFVQFGPGVNVDSVTNWALYNGAPVGSSSDVGDQLTCVVWADGTPEFYQIRDNVGAQFLTANVRYVASPSSPGYTAYSATARSYVGVAKVGGGWVVCWNSGGAIFSAYVRNLPPVFDWQGNVPSQLVSGVAFGGGERPRVFTDTMGAPGAGQITKDDGLLTHGLQDGQSWMLAASATANAPRYHLNGSGQVEASDASADYAPILIRLPITVPFIAVECDFTYEGSNLVKFELRGHDHGEGAVGVSSHYQFLAGGYDEATQKWYLLAQQLSGTTRADFSTALVVGQTYHVKVQFASSGVISLYVDGALIGTLPVYVSNPPDTPGNHAYVGFLMQHASFPGVSAKIANFTTNSDTYLTVPVISSVVPLGTPGATTYSYRVSAIDDAGETLASTAVATNTGNATLSSTNKNQITWGAVAGAKKYHVFGRTAGTQLLLATVTAPTVIYIDDGSVVTPAGALPITHNFLPKVVDRFRNFIGSHDDLESHLTDSGHVWHYGRPRLAFDGVGTADLITGTPYIKSHSSTPGYPGVLVSEAALAPCQKISMDVTVDKNNGDWSFEVRGRHNNQPGAAENYACFGYNFVAGGVIMVGANSFYLYRDKLAGAPQQVATVLTSGQTYNLRLEIDATSVRGYVDNVLVLTDVLQPTTGNGYVGFTLVEGSACLTKVRNFIATIGCGSLNALPASLVGLARGAQNGLVGMFYDSGSNVAKAWAGKMYLGWSGDRGRTWTTMGAPFFTEAAITGSPTLFPACQRRLVPIEDGNVAIVWRDAATDLPQHQMSRDQGRTVV